MTRSQSRLGVCMGGALALLVGCSGSSTPATTPTPRETKPVVAPTPVVKARPPVPALYRELFTKGSAWTYDVAVTTAPADAKNKTKPATRKNGSASCSVTRVDKHPVKDHPAIVLAQIACTPPKPADGVGRFFLHGVFVGTADKILPIGTAFPATAEARIEAAEMVAESHWLASPIEGEHGQAASGGYSRGTKIRRERRAGVDAFCAKTWERENDDYTEREICFGNGRLMFAALTTFSKPDGKGTKTTVAMTLRP